MKQSNMKTEVREIGEYVRHMCDSAPTTTCDYISKQLRHRCGLEQRIRIRSTSFEVVLTSNKQRKMKYAKKCAHEEHLLLFIN